MDDRQHLAWQTATVLIAILGIASVGLIFMAWPAPAQDRGAWFKSLRLNGVSCCDISDCRQTEATWRDGGWWAYSPHKKAMISVPEAKVLHSPMSIDGEAYLCEGLAGTIYCFVPPSPGS